PVPGHRRAVPGPGGTEFLPYPLTKKHRRLTMKPSSLGKLLAAVSFAVLSTSALAAYPEQPIRLTVGFPAGTGPDIVARTVGDQLAKEIGQSVVVENKAGAGGQIAAYSVA